MEKYPATRGTSLITSETDLSSSHPKGPKASVCVCVCDVHYCVVVLSRHLLNFKRLSLNRY